MSTAIFPRETDLDMPGMSMNGWRPCNQWLPIESGACDCLAKPWYKLVIAGIRKTVYQHLRRGPFGKCSSSTPSTVSAENGF